MKNIICFGDSITDCGKFFDAPPLGDGYVRMLDEELKKREKGNIVINKGFDGFTVARVYTTVRQQEISADSVCTLLVGINDVAIMMNTRRSEIEQQELMARFCHIYEKLILEILNSSKNLILMEPFIFPYPAEFRLWIPYVRIMSGSIASLADKYELPYIRLHDRLNNLALYKGFNAVTVDGVHLTHLGHHVIADELLKLL